MPPLPPCDSNAPVGATRGGVPQLWNRGIWQLSLRSSFIVIRGLGMVSLGMVCWFLPSPSPLHVSRPTLPPAERFQRMSQNIPLPVSSCLACANNTRVRATLGVVSLKFSVGLGRGGKVPEERKQRVMRSTSDFCVAILSDGVVCVPV